MGPTNQALVKLFQADQKYRQAQSRYDAASRDVRLQERKVNELTAKLDQTHLLLKEFQAKAGNTELDIRAREGKIERLRGQQQTAKNNKEYQAFLVQINTEKVDKAKVEDELLKLMEQVEKLQGESKTLVGQVEAEKQKLGQLREQITGRLEVLKKEIDDLRPARDAAAAEVSADHLKTFERLAERFDGEAMAAIDKPNRRVEEYICTACNMSLAPDIYNRLHSRDEAMGCPSCRRFLYIPDDLPVETAVNQKKKPKKTAEEKAAAAAEKAAEAAASEVAATPAPEATETPAAPQADQPTQA